MPFNGDIAFHDISLTIPENYIRDSTQSTDDFWVFERGNYKKCILLTRNDAAADATQILEDYVALMKEQEATSDLVTFMDEDAVLSTYYKDGVYFQEILFIYNSSSYAVALRGGTEAEFKEITNTLQKNAGDSSAAS